MQAAMPTRKSPKSRVRILDVLRGFSLISMIAYHATYDLVYMYGVDLPWYKNLPGFIWQQSICWVFILIAGASMHYSRNAIKHGLIVLGCGMILTVVTATAMPSVQINFGVLHMMGCSMLIVALTKKTLQKIPYAVGCVASFCFFAVLYGVPRGFVGFFNYLPIKLPSFLYGTDVLFWLGFPGDTFFSGDYFPLIPWLFLFLTGYYLWGICKDKFERKAGGKNIIEVMGRHSLIIYMAHQPIVLGVLWILAQTSML